MPSISKGATPKKRFLSLADAGQKELNQKEIDYLNSETKFKKHDFSRVMTGVTFHLSGDNKQKNVEIGEQVKESAQGSLEQIAI